MKSLAAIYFIVIMSCFGAFWYGNKCIVAITPVPLPYMVSDEPYVAPLSILDAGYNSSSDVAQSATGQYVYQRADYGTEFLQGGEDNTPEVIQPTINLHLQNGVILQ